MRQTFFVVAGAVLTIMLAGCSDSQPESGPVPYKAPTSPAIDALRENMSKNAKTGAYSKQIKEPETKTDTKAAAGKEAEKKP